MDEARPLGQLSQEGLDRLKRERKWAATDLGRLFIRMENAAARAWQTDSSETASDKSTKLAWEAHYAARAEFLKALRGW